MKTLLVENTWLPIGGWGNGYVLIPEGHPLHGVDYNELFQINVHGGLTFSKPASECEKLFELAGFVPDDDNLKSWVVGFDTAHFGDDKVSCSFDFVEKETEKLKEQITQYVNFEEVKANHVQSLKDFVKIFK